MEFYYKINQLDGRVENYRLNVIDPIIYNNLLYDLKGKVKSIEVITESDYLSNKKNETTQRVAIHADKHKPYDGKGEFLGTVEHYEIT